MTDAGAHIGGGPVEDRPRAGARGALSRSRASFRRWCRAWYFQVEEFVESKRPDVDQRRREEAETLLARSEGAQRVVLDERGTPVSSAEFTKLLGKWRDEGTSETTFLIGGADGHGERVRESGLALSFGRLTWPHQLFRVMLAEQLYRSVAILSGHPYHRA